MQARLMPSCGVRLSVRPSRSWTGETNKRRTIFIFLPSGRHTILVFRTKRYGNIPTGIDPHNGGVECRWGRQKSRSQPISGSIACCERFYH